MTPAELRASCTHQRVHYSPVGGDGEGWTPRWVCDDCRLEFTPKLVPVPDPFSKLPQPLYVHLSLDVSPQDRLAITLHYGQERTASREEVQRWMRSAIRSALRLLVDELVKAGKMDNPK